MHNLTRREVLQKGGVVAGGLVLGGTALSENAAADHRFHRGNMSLEGGPLFGVQFTHTFGFGLPPELPASCFASESELKNYRSLHIEYQNGDRQRGAIRADRNHLTEGTRYVFTSAVACKEPEFEGMWKASFRPA